MQAMPEVGEIAGRSRHLMCAAGIFSVLCSVYILTGPGRIDIIDGQVRYEVAKNWLDSGEPVVRDPHIVDFVIPHEGKRYGVYNAAPSIAAMPLILAERALPGHSADRERFAFSLTGAFFGAAVGVVLFAGFLALGVGTRPAAFWSMAFSLSTLWWPGSTTVFDQNQHAFFVVTSLLTAWQAGVRRSYALAAAGGLVGGLLFSYQENYGILLPAIALAVLSSTPASPDGETASARPRVTFDGVLRYLIFGASSTVGLALFFAFNFARFGTLFPYVRYVPAALFNANPIAGLLSLTLSLGKGVFLFSPPLVLAFFGARGLWRRAPALLVAIAAVTCVHVAFISNLVFFGGDWCWGPRYLLVLHPLWALTFPFALARLGARYVVALLASGVAIQLMGLSVDAHRFFYGHNLETDFWHDQWAYFKYTQLMSRPFEIVDMMVHGVPPDAVAFNSSPTREMTYCPYGPGGGEVPMVFMERFQMFYLPRPWPLWCAWLGPARQPYAPWGIVGACLAWLGAGVGAMWAALRRPPSCS